MGGARNLKQRGARAKAQGGQHFFVCVGQMSTLFSCSVHQKDIAGYRDPWCCTCYGWGHQLLGCLRGPQC